MTVSILKKVNVPDENDNFADFDNPKVVEAIARYARRYTNENSIIERQRAERRMLSDRHSKEIEELFIAQIEELDRLNPDHLASALDLLLKKIELKSQET